MSNYQVQSGTLLENFETIGDWTMTGTATGTATVNTSIFTEGSGSLKLTYGTGNAIATKTISVDMPDAGVVSIDVYYEDVSKVGSPTFFISSTTNFSKYFSVILTDLHNGWNTYRIRKEFWTNTGGESWDNTMVRLRVRIDPTAETSVYFDNLKYGIYDRPKVLWTCDDGWANQYTVLYDYAKKYTNFKATCYVFGSGVGTGSYMTTAQLEDLYNNGWDISNHTYNHGDLTELANQQAMEDEINLQKDWLVTNGFTRNNMHLNLCYPGGAFNDTVRLAVASTGITTARTVIANANWYNHPNGHYDTLIVRNLAPTTTLDSIKKDVDNAIACGGTLVIESHLFITPASESTYWPVEDMQALVDYIMKYVEGGVLDIMTVSEWYRGLTNPRKLA